mgnify:CR=1 FL=1
MKTLVTLIKQARADGCTGLAAMIAYNFFLVIPAMIILVVSAMTLLPIENTGERLAGLFKGRATGEAQTLIEATLERTFAQGRGWIFLLSLAGSLYVLSNGFAGLIAALNRIYSLRETRPWLKVRLRALIMSVIVAVIIIVVFMMVFIYPLVREAIFERGWVSGRWLSWLRLLRWPAIVFLVLVGIEGTYRYAPCGRGPRWRLISPGTGIAAGLWLLATAGFGFFVENFGSFSQVYGTLGTVIALLTWIWLSAMTFLIGAEINVMLRPAAGSGPVAADSGPPAAKRPDEV